MNPAAPKAAASNKLPGIRTPGYSVDESKALLTRDDAIAFFMRLTEGLDEATPMLAAEKAEELVDESKALLTERGLTPEESEDILTGCLACGKQGKAAWARGHAAIMRLAGLLPEESNDD